MYLQHNYWRKLRHVTFFICNITTKVIIAYTLNYNAEKIMLAMERVLNNFSIINFVSAGNKKYET